jgi:hypothetical protein
MTATDVFAWTGLYISLHENPPGLRRQLRSIKVVELDADFFRLGLFLTALAASTQAQSPEQEHFQKKIRPVLVSLWRLPKRDCRSIQRRACGEWFRARTPITVY